MGSYQGVHKPGCTCSRWCAEPVIKSATDDLLDPSNPIGLTNPLSPNNPVGIMNPASPINIYNDFGASSFDF